MSAEMNFIKSKWLLSEFNEFRETDPAFLKIKENRKKWIENNRDKMSKAQSKYVENNKEKVSKSMIKWQKENKDKLAESQRKYQRKNREKINKYYRERYKAISEIKSINT